MSLVGGEYVEPEELLGVSTVVPEAPSFTTEKGQLLDTEHGPINVTVQGDTTKPVIVTYHDVGLDHVSCFQGLLNYSQTQPLLEQFCLVHVDAPGQHCGAPAWDDTVPYPTHAQMASQIEVVVSHFNLESFIGLGAGAGGSILALYANKNPRKVKGLVCFGTDFDRAGWVEWGNLKIGLAQTKVSGGMTKWLADTLLTQYFSPTTCYDNVDLLSAFRDHLATRVHVGNLCLFASAMNSRLSVPDEIDGVLQVPVLWVYGSTAACTSGLDTIIPKLAPDQMSRIEVFDAGCLVHEERPDQVVTPLILFLQGLGFARGVPIGHV